MGDGASNERVLRDLDQRRLTTEAAMIWGATTLEQFTLSMDIGRDSPKFACKLMLSGQKKPIQPLVFFRGNEFNVGCSPGTKFGDLAAPVLEHKTADFGLRSIEANSGAPAWGKSISNAPPTEATFLSRFLHQISI